MTNLAVSHRELPLVLKDIFAAIWAVPERGDFGLSLEDRTQRIDITGHAPSALMKSVTNGIECGSLGS
jgi:hypothetical protein